MTACQTADCLEPAANIVQFPWAEPVAACTMHTEAARQLMVNLDRADELRVSELGTAPPAPGVLEPPAPDALASFALTPAATPAAKAERRLELELELESKRLHRVTLELELAQSVAAIFDRAPTLLAELLAKVSSSSVLFNEIEESVVEGAAATPLAEPEAPPPTPA